MKINKLFKSIIGLLPLSLSAIAPIASVSCSSQSQTDLDILVNKFLAIEDVKKVEILPNAKKFKHKLIIHVQQPVSWDDASKGTFNQRIEFGFNGYDNVNMVNIGGYELTESSFESECKKELVTRYNSNYLNIEYRYFGTSKPYDEYTPQIASYWDNLKIDYAIKDFHHINEVMRKVLNGKWVVSGGSKGGQTTDTYAMKYPSDADAFVAYVGPKCHLNTTATPVEDSCDNMMDWVLNDIGNKSSLGKTEAERYRYEVFQLQNYMLTTQAAKIMADQVVNYYLQHHFIFNDYVLQNHRAIYYCGVMDIAVGFWQQNMKIEDVETIIAMDEGTDKQQAAVNYLIGCGCLEDYNINSVAYPYYIQAWKEMGCYNANPEKFIYKTDAYNTKYPVSMPIPTFEGVVQSDYSTLRQKCAIPADVLNNTSYDDTIKNDLDAWTSNCQANVIMIFGEKDPWTAYKWANISSNNIHVFMNKGNSHNSKIENLDDDQKAQCWTLLDGWLK